MLTNFPVTATIPAVDLERAKKFYQENLGLTPKPISTPGYAMFAAGQASNIALYERGPSKADHTLACFTVDNIEETIAALQEKGVRFENYDFPGLKTVNHIATQGEEKAAWFKDSEGNILGLSQRP